LNYRRGKGEGRCGLDGFCEEVELECVIRVFVLKTICIPA
jgi:hypothetical protein